MATEPISRALNLPLTLLKKLQKIFDPSRKSINLIERELILKCIIDQVASCSSMIGQDVDWGTVKIWKTNYLPFRGPYVVAPDGENMYWGRNYLEDVTQDFSEVMRMVHEFVHIWQGQTNGSNVYKSRGSYDYSTYLRKGRGWSGMGIEGQAEVVTDLILRLNGCQPQYGNPVGYSPAYLRSLIPFSVPAYDNKQQKSPW